MERADLNGITLEYDVVGSGEPVVLIHGALVAAAFGPLVAEPALAGRYRFITYHRRGYLGSSRSAGPVSIAQQAADCRALLRHLGVTRAHVVGHSLGGSFALQLALDAPDLVHSLAVLEPALVVGASAQGYRDAIARNQARYAAGDAAGTVDEFLQARFGPGYRAAFLDRLLPQAFAQAVADAGTAFETDMPPLGDWRFGEAEAGRITQPVLLVLGRESDALWPRFGETHRLLLGWLPQAEEFVLPGATHALQMQNPRDLAPALVGFFARHPLPHAAPRRASLDA
jgi:pimeloyl-ACP methyl ester carboxylesterase